MRFSFLIIIFCAASGSCAKIFTRCELVEQLKLQGFPQYQLPDWVCLVEAESSRQTDAVGGPDDDGSYDYGLFQINDRYWCNSGPTPGKGCNLRCNDLLTDNIRNASQCTKIIYKEQGFDAWLGWTNECKHKQLPDISYCFNLKSII